LSLWVTTSRYPGTSQVTSARPDAAASRRAWAALLGTKEDRRCCIASRRMIKYQTFDRDDVFSFVKSGHFLPKDLKRVWREVVVRVDYEYPLAFASCYSSIDRSCLSLVCLASNQPNPQICRSLWNDERCFRSIVNQHPFEGGRSVRLLRKRGGKSFKEGLASTRSSDDTDRSRRGNAAIQPSWVSQANRQLIG